MIKKTIALAAILLAGCGYDYSELQAARGACDSYNGEFSYSRTGQLIKTAYCKVDGVTYRIGRTSFKLMEGRVL